MIDLCCHLTNTTVLKQWPDTTVDNRNTIQRLGYLVVTFKEFYAQFSKAEMIAPHIPETVVPETVGRCH